MANTIEPLLQQITSSERTSGLMNIFMGLSQEQQVALMEWARSLCMKIAAYIEQHAAMEASGMMTTLNLPAPKMYIELALKIGMIRAVSADNEELAKGCEQACRTVLGDNKVKDVTDFKETVRLAQRLSKW